MYVLVKCIDRDEPKVLAVSTSKERLRTRMSRDATRIIREYFQFSDDKYYRKLKRQLMDSIKRIRSENLDSWSDDDEQCSLYYIIKEAPFLGPPKKH